MAIFLEVGDRACTLFQTDRWIYGPCSAYLIFGLFGFFFQSEQCFSLTIIQREHCFQPVSAKFQTSEQGHGLRVADLAPQDFALVPKRRANKRTVKDALNNHSWIYDIQGAITVGVIAEFLDLWDILSEVVLQPTYTSHIFFYLFRCLLR